VPDFDWASVIERLTAAGEATADSAASAPDGVTEDPRAAVATVLREGASGVEALFIKRADRDGDPWSGHVAFPGGKREPADGSLLGTALRETEEEVGLRLAASSYLARLPDVRARSNGYRVAHFVLRLDDRDAAIVTSPEVAAVLWVPLTVLAFAEPCTARGVFPGVKLGDYVLWGMTYRMVGHLLDAAQAGR
jgi:8-oxo-dGTP pyrophosphatase MutT (NUDIX family)